jgi:hypothetical protein
VTAGGVTGVVLPAVLVVLVTFRSEEAVAVAFVVEVVGRDVAVNEAFAAAALLLFETAFEADEAVEA